MSESVKPQEINTTFTTKWSMVTKAIKVSEESYRLLCERAGSLQQELGEFVSLDRALSLTLRKTMVSDLAGSWNMTDKEKDEFLASLKKGWVLWNKKPV